MALLSTPNVIALTAVGESFTIEASSSIKKVTAGDTFAHQYTLTGAPVSVIDSFFTSEFRYSTNNGQSWTDWADCNDSIGGDYDWSGEVVDDELPYLFQWRVTVTSAFDGTLTSVNFTAIEIEWVQGSDSNDVRDRRFKSDSLFNGIQTDDDDWVEVKYNLLEKVKGYGIVDAFIERTSDFVHFWDTIVSFLTLCYMMGYRFATIYNDAELLRRYLEEKGLFIPYQADLATLQSLADDYIHIARDRGTAAAITEIQAIINKGANEFFQAVFLKNIYVGWNTSKQTPLNGSLSWIREINLMPEAEWDEITDKNNYELRNGAGMTIVADTDVEGNAIDVFNHAITVSSMGVYDETFDLNSTKKILIDTRLDWELSFYAKTSAVQGLKPQQFGVEIIDLSGNVITLEGMVVASPPTANRFNNTYGVLPSIFPVDEWIRLKGVILNKNHTKTPDGLSYEDHALGIQHLRFPSSTPDYVWVYPVCTFGNPIGGGSPYAVRSYGYRLAVASTEDAKLGALTGIHQALLKYWTNNSDLSDQSIDQILTRYHLDSKQALITMTTYNRYIEELLSTRALFWWDSDNTTTVEGGTPAIGDLGKDNVAFTTQEGTYEKPSLNLHGGVVLDGTEIIQASSEVMQDADTYGIIWYTVFRVDSVSDGVITGQITEVDAAGAGDGICLALDGGDVFYATDAGFEQALFTAEAGKTYMVIFSAVDSSSGYLEAVDADTGEVLYSGVSLLNVNVEAVGITMGSDHAANYAGVTMYLNIVMAWNETGAAQTTTGAEYAAIREYIMNRYGIA